MHTEFNCGEDGMWRQGEERQERNARRRETNKKKRGEKGVEKWGVE